MDSPEGIRVKFRFFHQPILFLRFKFRFLYRAIVLASFKSANDTKKAKTTMGPDSFPQWPQFFRRIGWKILLLQLFIES
jgi:hypothetical protein